MIGTLVKRFSPVKRARLLSNLIYLVAKSDTPANSIRFLLETDNILYSLEGKWAVLYGDGIHTKHRHTNYHRFFIENLKPGEDVLDIGCGNGFLAYDMACHVDNVKVIGIEMDQRNVSFAIEHYNHPNLQFIHGDALKDLPNEEFDVVTLSNVLEHIEHRVIFLNEVMKKISPKRFIIRVPMYERDWRVSLKKELGIDYRLDATHYIEYTYEGFAEELRQAGLGLTYAEFRWGEIWCVAEPLIEVKS